MTIHQSFHEPATSHAPVRIERIDLAETTNRRAWDSYVFDHPDATFFYRAGWPYVVQSVYRHNNESLIARQDGRIVGLAPLTHIRSPLFGSSLVSAAFTVGGGVLANSAPIASALAVRAAERGRELGVQFVELRGGRAQFADWRTKSDLYAGFIKDIPEDEDANLKMIPRKKRADLRKALKSDLYTDPDANIAEFYELYSESVRNLGTPVLPRKFISALKTEFQEDMEISVVRAGQTSLAGLVSFYFRDVVLPYYGGAVHAARALHAYDYQYWSLMRRACARGARQFDFGRSKTGAGAYAYKKFWGFAPTPLEYQFALIRAENLPEINPLNPKYRAMVAIWRRLPLPVANLLGPMIARQIG